MLSEKKSNEKNYVTLEKCKKILNRNGNNYSDEDVLKIRDLLYTFAEIEYTIFIKNNQDEKNGNHLHQGINRRAS